MKTDRNYRRAFEVRLCLVALAALLFLYTAASSTAQTTIGESIQSRTGTLQSFHEQTKLLSSPPAPHASAPQAPCSNESLRQAAVPEGPKRSIPAPNNPPTLLPDAPHINAPTDFVVKRNISLEGLTASGGDIQQNNTPSVGAIGPYVFFTGDHFAGYSSDYGQTFSYVDPYTTIPVPASGGFCCRQWVAVAPNQKMLLWCREYDSDETGNVIRISFLAGEEALQNQTWLAYDLTAAGFGFPSDNILDAPTITTSGSKLWLTADVYNQSFVLQNTMITNIPLDEIPTGNINFQTIFLPGGAQLRCTEGATNVMYIARNLNTTTERFYIWPETSSTASVVNIGIAAYTPLLGDGVAMSPDGTNWAGRAFSRPEAATVADGKITVMFHANADAGAGRPYPYTRMSTFDASDLSLLGESDVYADDSAFLYPSASPNGAGAIGGTIYFGGGDYYPSSGIWINDDVGITLPGSLLGASVGTAGPSGNKWGEFFTTHPHGSFGNSWTATACTIDGSVIKPRYYWFGRDRDLHPPNDNFVNAAQLVGASTVATVSNVEATKEPGEPDHAGNPGGSSIWWKWTAPNSGLVALSTFGSSIDTLLAVYAGESVDSLLLVADNDDCNPPTDRTSCTSFQVGLGITYMIAVDGFGGQSGDVQLSLELGPPIAGGVCESAVVVGDGTYFGSTNGEDLEYPYFCALSNSPDVWYYYVPGPNICSTTFSLCGSSYNTQFALHAGCPGSVDNLLACDFDSCGVNEILTVEHDVPGAPYLIRIGGEFDDAGVFALTITSHQCETPTPTDTPSNTPTATPSPTETEHTQTPTDTPSRTPSPTPSPTETIPTITPTDTPSRTPTATPSPICGRIYGDFDSSGFIDVIDFLFLLDFWQFLPPSGPPIIGLSDFLSLLDNWQTSHPCS